MLGLKAKYVLNAGRLIISDIGKMVTKKSIIKRHLDTATSCP